MMTEAKIHRKERFAETPNEIFAEFNDSFKFDRRLFAADVRASIAYCEALFHAGILTRLESERIKNGLQTILKRADFNKNYFDELPSEDVHTFIEARLIQLVGEASGKLQTGRSRNEQVTTAFRIWLREAIEEISKIIRDLQNVLIRSAENQKEAVLPAYANLRPIQPILWAHWCLAYFEMFARDRERFDEVWRRVNVLPLGSADAAGTSIEIDRESVARELGFEGVTANSLDAVSDRDFAIEFVGACALTMMHLSRLAEDLILYSSIEFGFIESNNVALNGLNSMPQKKNADALELVRGKAGRIFGHQTALLSMMKNLPLTYNKDMREDKEAVFDTVDTVSICLKVVTIVIENLRVKEQKTREAASNCYLNAAELTDYLVQKGISFGNANETIGKIVSFAVSKNMKIEELTLKELQNFSGEIGADVFAALSLEQIIASKNQIGGTAPERVFEALEAAKESLDRE